MNTGMLLSIVLNFYQGPWFGLGLDQLVFIQTVPRTDLEVSM